MSTVAPTPLPTVVQETNQPVKKEIVVESKEIVVQERAPTECLEFCSTPRAIYSVFHTIMFFIAILLSFRCNRGFSFGSFLIACLCPPIYIFYIIVTEYDRGMCGLINPLQQIANVAAVAK
jgi:hypothetical protein